MWHFVQMALRALAGIAGALSLYAALFLYEDEQGKFQNKLEEWWVRLSDKQSEALSGHTAFMQEVARLTACGFDLLFGKKLFALPVYEVCAYFTFASISLSFAIDDLAVSGSRHSLARALGLGLTAVGVLPVAMYSVIPRDWKVARLLRSSFLGFDVVGFYLVGVAALGAFSLTQDQLGLFTDVSVLCFAFDVILITAIRWTLRWSSSMDHFGKIAGVVFINLVLGVMLVVAPIRASEVLHAPTLSMVARGNIIAALASSAFVLLGLTMLAHKLLWPMINRPLYSLQDLGIRRKLFSIAGFALLTYAGWDLPELLKKMIA